MPQELMPYLTPKEVVGILQSERIFVTDDTVRNWCTVGLQNKKHPEKRHRLDHGRVGSRFYIIRESLLQFLPLLAERCEAGEL
jgi:hypothetical protein